MNGQPSLLPMVVSATSVQLLGVTVAKIAVPAIQSGLGASPGSMHLVLAGYSLAYACLLITAARLGDGYRYQRLFMLGTTVFTTGSVVCVPPRPARDGCSRPSRV
ncbi:hypothetical protein [Streptomyces sp. NPDC059063]|uniref:hypothetical protein n=1 Tax=unclassified Streptomyces TaxID=2593676 RepID=UPI00369446B8